MTRTDVLYSMPMMASARKWPRPADTKLTHWPALSLARPCANTPVSGARMGRNRFDGHRYRFSSARIAVCGVKTIRLHPGAPRCIRRR